MQKQIAEKINDQVNKEFFSAYLYLAIANYYERENLDGFANWFRVQTMEERDHAFSFIQYLQDNDEAVTLKEIAEPKNDFSSFSDPLELAYHHERSISERIGSIYEAALEAKDYRTMQYLDWFVREQMEEEKTARDLLDRFRLFGTEAKSLYLLDNELKARTYTPPATAPTV